MSVLTGMRLTVINSSAFNISVQLTGAVPDTGERPNVSRSCGITAVRDTLRNVAKSSPVAKDTSQLEEAKEAMHKDDRISVQARPKRLNACCRIKASSLGLNARHVCLFIRMS